MAGDCNFKTKKSRRDIIHKACGISIVSFSISILLTILALFIVPVCAESQVLGFEKISNTQGGAHVGALGDSIQFGTSIAYIGDLNNDGFDDIVVGSPTDNDGGSYQGAVWILFLDGAGAVDSYQKISETSGGFTGTLDPDDYFGSAVALLGDVDDDGVDDIAVGAPGSDVYDANDVGTVWVLFMNENGTVKSYTEITEYLNFDGSLTEGCLFGSSIAGIGDLDGNGVEDMAVGARAYGEPTIPGFANLGAVFILFLDIYGQASATQMIGPWYSGGFADLLAEYDYFGCSVAAVGDLDGDLVSDIIVGAPGDDDGGLDPSADRGALYALFLDTSGLVVSQQKISHTEGGFTGSLNDGDLFGSSVASMGDLDDDGVAEIAVGAVGDSTAGNNYGAVWTVYLNGNGTVKTDALRITEGVGGFTGSLGTYFEFGAGVASLGDENHDGLFTIAVGSVGDDDGGGYAGSAVGSVWLLQYLPTDSDGDGVPDIYDFCDITDASYFDWNRDGCIDAQAGGRHVEYWAYNDTIDFHINQIGAPYIADGSDIDALSQAITVWQAIPATYLTMWWGVFPGEDIASALDGVSTITMTDDEYPFSPAVLAVGVTNSFTEPTYHEGEYYLPGQIVDADMILNPTKKFKTDTSGGTGTDLQSVAVHEAGHLYGISHTAVTSSSMYFVLPGGTAARTIEPDDSLVFLRAYYDSSITVNMLGGTVQEGIMGDPVPGALVFVTDAVSGDTVVCDVTTPLGAYMIYGLPDGDYYVSIHPMDGSSKVGYMKPSYMNFLVDSTAVTNFVAEYYDAAESSSDNPQDKIIVSQAGAPQTNIDFITNIDTTPPSVTSISPANAETDVSIDAAVLIKFDEAIDDNTISGNFSLTGPGGGVAGNAAVIKDDSMISFKPTGQFEYASLYTLTLDTGLADKYGNNLTVPYVSTFTTGAQPPLSITSLVPNKGVVGSVVIVNGFGFDPVTPANNDVQFQGSGGPTSATVTQVTPTQITAEIPAGAVTGEVTVTVGGGPPSNGITYTVLSSEEVVRGYEAGSKILGVLPRSLSVLPDGSCAYVATATGAFAVDLAVATFLDTTSIYISGGLDELDCTPDGKRVYAVSRVTGKIHIIDSDNTSVTQHQELDNVSAEADPLGIVIEPGGTRAYVSTFEGDVQIWDIREGSGTYKKQIGVMVPPDPNIRDKMAIDPTGKRLLVLSGVGNLYVYRLGPDSLEATIAVGPNPRDIVTDQAGQRAYVTDGSGLVTVVSLDQMLNVIDINTGGTLRGIDITPAGMYLIAANRELNLLDAIDLNENNPTYRSVAATVSVGTNPVDVVVSPDGVYAYSLIEAENKLVATTIGSGPILRSVFPKYSPTGSIVCFAGTGFYEINPTDYATFTAPGGTYVTDIADFATSISRIFTVPTGAISGPASVTLDKAGGGETSNELFFGVVGPTLGSLDLKESKTTPVVFDMFHTAAVSPIGDQVFFTTQAGHLVMYDADENSATFNEMIDFVSLAGDSIADVAVTPDGRTAYVASPPNATVYVVDINRSSSTYGQQIATIDIDTLQTMIKPLELAVSPDGSTCLIFDQFPNVIYVVDITSGSPRENIANDTVTVRNVSEIAFHPTGRWAYAASGLWGNSSIYIIDMIKGSGSYGNVIATYDLDHHPTSLSFYPDGDSVAVLALESGLNNPYFIILDTTDPVNPSELNSWAPDVLPVPSPYGARIRVSPRGDRVMANLPGGGGLYVMNTSSYPYPIERNFSTISMQGKMDHAFSPDGNRVYAVSEATDSLFFFEFGDADSIYIVSGDGQTGVVDQPLPAKLRVAAVRAPSTVVPGVAITFQVTSGGGVFTGNNTNKQVVVTDANGIAEVEWKLGSALTTQVVQASSAELAGSPLTFTAMGVADPNTLPLSLSGVVPTDGSADISVTTSIQATFSRAVKQDTAMLDSTFYLHVDGDPTPVQTVIGFADNNRKLSLMPVNPLDYSTPYKVQIKGELRDESDGFLDNPDSVMFTTKASPISVTLAAVTPPSATVATPIVLSGLGFDPTPGNNTVYFNGVAATPADAGVDYLNVIVPLNATTGTISVEVGATMSNTKPFTVLTPVESPGDSVVATVGTGYATKSAAITPDGLWLYTVSPESDKVVPIDIERFDSEPSISVGDHPISIDINPKKTYAYIPNFNSGSISIIDLDTLSADFNEVVETAIIGGNPIDIAVSPDGSRIYVANAGSSNLDVIDGDELSATYHQVIASVGTGSTTKTIAVTPDGARIYIGTTTGYVVIDAESYGVIASVGTGSSTKTIAITPDGTLLVLLTTESEVLIVDIMPGSSSENQVIASVGTGSTTKSIAVTPDGTLLYLIQEEGDNIIVVSIQTIGSMAVVDPDMSLHPREVIVAVLDTIQANEDPEIMVFDPTGSGLAVVTNAGPQMVTFINTAGPPPVLLTAPPDTTIPPLEAEPTYVLDGFTITNNLPVDLSFIYNVTADGPAALVDNGDPASLSDTTPLLTTGQMFTPPDAALTIPRLTEWAQEVVTYRVSALQDPYIVETVRTVITIEPPQQVAVLISTFSATSVAEGVQLVWDISTDEGIGGFNVYRSPDALETGELLNTDGAVPASGRTYVDKTVLGGTSYFYRLGVVREDGSEVFSPLAEVKTRIFPFALYQNFPNPFNPTTRITFSLPTRMHVTLSIYNIEGKRVVTLVDDTLSEGFKEIVWNGTDSRGSKVSSGVYFYRLKTDKKVLTKKLILLR